MGWFAHVFLAACFAGIGAQLPAEVESFVEVQSADQHTSHLIRREQVHEAQGKPPHEEELEAPVIETRDGPTLPPPSPGPTEPPTAQPTKLPTPDPKIKERMDKEKVAKKEKMDKEKVAKKEKMDKEKER